MAWHKGRDKLGWDEFVDGSTYTKDRDHPTMEVGKDRLTHLKDRDGLVSKRVQEELSYQPTLRVDSS